MVRRVILDEVQCVPEISLTIKYDVDENRQMHYGCKLKLHEIALHKISCNTFTKLITHVECSIGNVMKKLPIGIQSFRKIIEQGYVYIDKTEQIYQLITQGETYFLARPRRFGKSLLISTLHELFSGNKELFKGLAITQHDYSWKKHPIIYLNFSAIDYKTPQELQASLIWRLYTIGDIYGIDLAKAPSLTAKFQYLIEELAKINSVVILIDEYDYAIVNMLHKPEIANENRELLRSFFGIIKGADQYLRHVFITGISKFSQTSIFSGLNNLDDLTMDPRSATLLGYTQNEIALFLSEHLDHTADKLQITHDELLEQMRIWYNGYLFDIDAQKVYNPFSILKLMQVSRFQNFWFATGTPTFLINLIKTRDYTIQEFEGTKASESDLGNFKIEMLQLKTVLYQTGYLTLKGYDANTRHYTLGFPNQEVRTSFLQYLLEYLIHIQEVTFSSYALQMKTALENNNPEIFIEQFKLLLAHIPFELHEKEGIERSEKFYHMMFYVIAKMIGFDVIVEESTALGKIDAVFTTKTHIYYMAQNTSF